MARISLRLILMAAVIMAAVICYLYYDYLESQRVEHIDATQYTTEFYVAGSTVPANNVLEGLADLSERYQVSVVKTTYELHDGIQRVVYSGVFYENTYPIEQIGIVKGSFVSSSDEVLASYDSGMAEQSGKLYVFGGNRELLIQSLERQYAEKGHIDGRYHVVSTRPYDGVSLVKELSNIFKIDSDSILRRTMFSQSIISGLVPIMGAALILICLVFSLVAASVPITNVKEIGIQKLNGFSNLDIWWRLLQGPLFSAVITGVAFDFLLLMWVKSYAQEFLVWLIISQAITVVVFTGVASLSILVLQKLKVSDIVKKSVSMRAPLVMSHFLKAVLFLFLGIVVVAGAFNFDLVVKEYENSNRWGRYGNYMVFSSVQLSEDDIDSLASGDTRLPDKFASLYSALNTQYGGIYATSSDYPSAERIGLKYQTLTVNPNYLEEFSLYDSDGQQIIIPESEKNRVVLIPESKSSEKEALSVSVLELAQSARDADFARRGLSAPQENLQIRIILYRDTDLFFSFNPNIASESGCQMASPVISVVTEANILESEKHSLLISGIAAPLKFKLNDAQAAKLRTFLSTGTVAENQIKLDTIENCLAENIGHARDAIMFFLAAFLLVFAVGVLSSVLLLLIWMVSKGKWFYVARLHGLSIYDCFKYEGIFLCVLYFVVLIVAAIISKAHPITTFLLAMAVMDITILIAVLKHLESKNIAALLKGA